MEGRGTPDLLGSLDYSLQGFGVSDVADGVGYQEEMQ